MHTISTEGLGNVYECIWDCMKLANSDATDDMLRKLSDDKFLQLVGQKRTLLLPQYGIDE